MLSSKPLFVVLIWAVFLTFSAINYIASFGITTGDREKGKQEDRKIFLFRSLINLIVAYCIIAWA